MSIWQTVGDILSLGQVSRNKAKKEEAERDRATEVWEQMEGKAPSAYDLQGYGMYGAQAPDEYIQQYMAENATGRSGGALGAARAGRLEDEARQQWVREQMAHDPLFGLGANRDAALAGVNADPAMVVAQTRALEQMQDIASAGGYTQAERDEMRLGQRNAAQFERSQREAALQQAQARGMGAGGASMMGALAAQQGSANRAADQASQVQIAAQMRALQAMQQSGQMASQARAQGFGESSQRASAADQWNQYRTGLTQQRQQGAGHAAQNVFANQMQVASGKAGQYQANAGAYQQDQQQLDANVTNAANSVANIYTAGAAGAKDDDEDEG